MTDHSPKEFSVPSLGALREELRRVGASGAPTKQQIPRHRLVWTLVALTIFGTSFGGALLYGGGSETDERPRAPIAGGFSADGPVYESLHGLVAESDLIVMGTVEDSFIGKVHDDDPTGQFPSRDLHTVVRVEELLKGSKPGDEITVVTIELAFAGPNLDDWREPGDRVLLFLTRSSETPGAFILANINYLQTAYSIQGDDVGTTIGGDTTGLAERISALSLVDLRRAIRVP